MRLKTVTIAAITTLFVASGFAPPLAEAPDAERQLAYFSLKVWLSGPYTTNAMSTNLNPTYIPLSQPYADSFYDGTPMDYDGTESVASWGGALSSAVDWVLVELRTTTAAASKVATQAAILMSDGMIRPISGAGDLVFSGVNPDVDYYVVVRHRNHVPIMSNALVDPTNGTPAPTLYDMTVEANIYSGVGSNGAKALGGGEFGLYAGDANGSGGTGAEDSAIWLPQNGFVGYLSGDFNLSGGAGAEDQAIWLGNPSILTLVPES